jgi:hypothetical protein
MRGGVPSVVKKIHPNRNSLESCDDRHEESARELYWYTGFHFSVVASRAVRAFAATDFRMNVWDVCLTHNPVYGGIYRSA